MDEDDFMNESPMSAESYCMMGKYAQKSKKPKYPKRKSGSKKKRSGTKRSKSPSRRSKSPGKRRSGSKGKGKGKGKKRSTRRGSRARRH